MAVRPLNPARVSPATATLYTALSDGNWHTNADLITATAEFYAEREPDKARDNGRRVRRKSLANNVPVDDAELIMSGAKDHARNLLMIGVRSGRLEREGDRHRLTPETLVVWNDPATAAALTNRTPKKTTTKRTPRAESTSPDVEDTPTPAAEDTPTSTKRRRTSAPLIFAGITEAEGFAAAPLKHGSRVHFRTSYLPIPLDEFRRDLPADCDVTFDESEGLYRVGCPHGTGDEMRTFITDWCEARNIETQGMRPEHNVYRRDLKELDPAFLSDLCEHYERYSRGRLKKHITTLQFHFTDPHDLTQQVFEWVLEAIARYDDTKSVPFGAFLSERLSKWVHDLNRSKYGRPATDAELKQQRATQQFVTAHGRKPTEAELAAALNMPIAAFRKSAGVVAALQGIRNMQTLDTPDGAPEIRVTDDSYAEDRIMEDETTSLLSAVLTSACTPDATARTTKEKTNPNLLGWVAMYESLWGGMNKTEVSAHLSTSIRNMNQHTEKVQNRMKERRADLASH